MTCNPSNVVPPKTVKSAAPETRLGYSESTRSYHPKGSHLREKSSDRLSVMSYTTNVSEVSNCSRTLQDDDNGFQRPNYVRKDEKRQEAKRRRIIFGKSHTQSGSFKGAPEPSRELFIYRVDPSTTDSQISSYLNDNNFTVREISCISNPNARFKSFKLKVPATEFQKLFNETLWPEGVRIRKFIRPRDVFNKEDNR